jgi:PIN domain nuclease of toxin-antitoxin system
MSKIVLNASALLALCFAEKGADVTTKRGKDGMISAVNYSEAVAKCIDKQVPPEKLAQAVAMLNLAIVPFSADHAHIAASFAAPTRPHNFSFADRACLSTATVARCPVLTGDRKWKDVSLGVDIILIR